MTSDGIEIENHITVIMQFRAMNMQDMERTYLERITPEIRSEVELALRTDEASPGSANVVSDKEEAWYRPSWYTNKENWKRYRELLKNKELKETVIESIDENTTQLMCQLANPNQLDDFQTYGVVLGYVQSGKTANYTALIAKAVDAGYDFIVVLAGLHNNLRLQTQHRIDRELTAVDYETLPGIKVEKPRPDNSWYSLTSDDDFNVKGNARHTMSDKRPIYTVMKKNVTVMEKFLEWLSQAGEDVLNGKKMLLIDDEADHGTVNTGKAPEDDDEDDSMEEEYWDEEPGDLDPSRTNECIRKILQLFSRRAYVGYTATPFANVLIDPYDEDVELGPSLYPRDFIISLPKPENYIGAEDLFPETIEPSALEGQIRIIPDDEARRIRIMTEPREQSADYFGVEKSLRNAMLDFILTGCCKLHRGQIKEHHSMLIHCSHYKEVQSWLMDRVEKLWNFFRNNAKYSNQFPALLEELEKRWNKHFLGKNQDTVEPWNEIKTHLNDFCQSVEVREINSKSGGDLDYHNHKNGLRVIAIGGNKLSRGLTLEGLTVSYFGRPTRMYDSLLQMGRWFGFHPGYGDLVRLHLTANLLEWFSWLAHVERQIRLDIERYDRLNKSPLELAVRIQTHPELQVTSRLKRRSAVEIQVGWDGQTASTLYVNDDNKILKQNITTTSSFVEMLQSSKEKRMVESHHIWDKITGAEIIQFINSMKYPKEESSFDPKSISKYVERQVGNGELNDWSVALISIMDKSRSKQKLGDLEIRTVKRTRQRGSNKIPDLLDNKHLSLDLEGHPERFTHPDKYFPKNVMWEYRPKSQGLLIIYVLDGHDESTPTNSRESIFAGGEDRQNIVSIGIVFPNSIDAERANYVAVRGVPPSEY